MSKVKTILSISLIFYLILGSEFTESKEQNKHFSLPVWHEDARWEIQKMGGCKIPGHLDGPALEMEYFSLGIFDICYPIVGSGKYVFNSYDSSSSRSHTVAGSARGYLDGPFSRARFGGWDYVVRSLKTMSDDKRYLYFLDGYNGDVIRSLDLKKQEVNTLLSSEKGVKGIVADGNHHLYLLTKNDEMIKINSAGKIVSKIKIESKESIGIWGASLALDNVNSRIYATAYGTKQWYIWYWTLDDGSFHGVLPMGNNGGVRKRNEPGSFTGVNLYPQGTVMFGPDDPEKRFLYTGRTDTWSLFRLDLKTKKIWALTTSEGWSHTNTKKRVAFFVKDRLPRRVPFYNSGTWLPDGSFISRTHSPYEIYLFKRIH